MKRLTAALVLLLTVGCASVHNGPMQRIRVESEPEGAAVVTHECGELRPQTHHTPATIMVSRRAIRCELEILHPEFQPVGIMLRRTISHRTAENAEIAGAILDTDWSGLGEFAILGATGLALAGAGLGVDFATGAMYEQSPSRIFVDLYARAEEEAWRDRGSDVDAGESEIEADTAAP